MINPLPTLAIIIVCVNAYAQDILTKTSGEDILGKVVEVNATTVKYKKFDSPDSTLYELAKTELLMIRYEDGTKDIFVQTNATNTASPAPSDNERTTRCQALLQRI